MELRTILLIASAVFSVSTVRGQTEPAFDVASVKPAGEVVMGTRLGVVLSPGRARFTRMSLTDLLACAFRVRNFQISAPGWADSAYFTIDANVPAGATANQVPDMLRRLLEDRFQIGIRRETRDFSVYVLSVAEGPSKLLPYSSDGPKPTGGLNPMTLEALAQLASRAADKPVVNLTGLSSEYLIPLNPLMGEVNRRNREAAQLGRAMPDGEASDPGVGTLSKIIADMGLKLTAKKMGMPFLVLEKAEKTPLEN